MRQANLGEGGDMPVLDIEVQETCLFDSGSELSSKSGLRR
jgi:hypothetical protein